MTAPTLLARVVEWCFTTSGAVVVVIVNVWASRLISHREHRKTAAKIDELHKHVTTNGNGRDH